ncbi:hypothetical protein MRX96_049693 [Rhipicephalus microplus]
MKTLSDEITLSSNQLAWKKAAAMYQACVAFASSNRIETKYLVDWMLSLNLDFFNETRLATVNPVEMMVRGSLDLGVQAVVAITFGELEFVNSKRKIQSESVGKDGLRYLVAWSFYRKLIKYTVPRLLRNYVSANTACYAEIKEFMNLAVMSSYFTSVVPPRMIYQTKRMAYRIRSAFEKSLNSSNWIGRDIRDELINKLIDMTFYVGSQGQRSDPAFVEEIYRPYPDAPQEPFFPTWMKVLSLSSHYTWTDQNALLYNEAAPNGFYIIPYNDIVVSPGIMQSPFLYLDGPIALNYGGLGMLSLSGQHETLNDTVDSENLADLVGTMVAYAAYSSSPQKYKDVKLVNLDISTERLFFINHCVKWCAERTTLEERYAPLRSRCIVPLMNMPEFSRAFGCAPGSPMNPREKCAFW